MDDGRKPRFSQDNVGGTSGSISSTFDGDTDVGSRKGRSVVCTVTSHSTKVTKTLDTLDNFELVLWEHPGETVGVHDHFVQVLEFRVWSGAVLEHLGSVHVVTQTETSTGFLCDSELVTSNHLNLDTEANGVINGLLGVGTRGVKDGEQTDELETGSLHVFLELGTRDILVGDSKSTETTSSVFFNIGFQLVLETVGLVSGAEFDNDTSHTLGGTLELASIHVVSVGDLGSFVDGVERFEVEELDTCSSRFGVWEGTDDTTVNSILVLGSGCVGGKETDTLDVPVGVALYVLLVDGELVGGKSTGLVRAENGDTSKFLNGGDTGDDGLVLSELLSSDGEGDGQDGRHGDGNTTDQKHKDVVETTSVSLSEVGVENEDLEQDEDTDGNQTEGTDTSENHLQVTSLVVVLTDEGGSTTEEGVGTGGDDDTFGFTLFTSGTRETLVSELLALRKGFTGKSGLVHSKVVRLGLKDERESDLRDINSFDETTVGRADVTVFESDQVTGDELGRLDFFPGTVTLDLCLRSERVHECLDGVSGVSLLDETDGGVDQEQENDTDEILPIGGSTTTVGQGNGD